MPRNARSRCRETRSVDEGQRLALLAEVGVAPDDWTRADHRHTRALVDDLAAGRTDRPNAYAALCAAEKRRRHLAAPPPPDAPAPLAPLPPAPSPAPTPASVVAPLRVVPQPGDRPGNHLARRMIADRPPELPPPPPPLPPPPPPPRRPGAHLADTMIVDLADALRKQAAQLLVAAAASPRPDAPPAPPPPSADPATLRGPLAPAALASGTIPAPEVALEAYVLLRAELAVAPEHEAAVLAKYGLEDPAARRALDDHWRRLTAADPAACAELVRLVAAHGEWLRGQPR